MLTGINDWMRPMFPGDKLNIDKEEQEGGPALLSNGSARS